MLKIEQNIIEPVQHTAFHWKICNLFSFFSSVDLNFELDLIMKTTTTTTDNNTPSSYFCLQRFFVYWPFRKKRPCKTVTTHTSTLVVYVASGLFVLLYRTNIAMELFCIVDFFWDANKYVLFLFQKFLGKKCLLCSRKIDIWPFLKNQLSIRNDNCLDICTQVFFIISMHIKYKNDRSISNLSYKYTCDSFHKV